MNFKLRSISKLLNHQHRKIMQRYIIAERVEIVQFYYENNQIINEKIKPLQ